MKSGAFIAALAISLGVGACERPRAREVIAPDGTAALHVQCGDDFGECYARAGGYCPGGYVMEPSVGGAESGSFLVRCRVPWVVAAPLPVPAPATSAASAWPAPATAEWPPLEGADQAPPRSGQPVPRVHTTGPDDPGY